MEIDAQERRLRRMRRHARVRKHVSGTAEQPRLAVFRSAKHIYAQLIDDTQGRTLAAASTLSPQLQESLESGANVAAAEEVGRLVAKRALEQGIQRAIFDRGGYLYHGRVRALADAARAGGLDMGLASDREEILEKYAQRKAKKQPKVEEQKTSKKQQKKKAGPQQQKSA